MIKKTVLTQTTNKIFLYLLLLAIHSSFCFCNDKTKPYPVIITKDNVNMPTRGSITIQYSESSEKSDIEKIVDNNVKTKLISPHSKFYILWTGDNDEIVNYYSLTSANDSPKKDPTSWKLSGSNNNETWILLDKQKDQKFRKRGETKEYVLENKDAYKYYRLDIEGNGGDNFTQIAEWSMQYIEDSIEDLMQFSNGDSHSELTPMGIFFQHRHKTKPEDLIWLNDATQDAPFTRGDDRKLTNAKVNLFPHGDPKPTDAIQRTIDNCSAIAVLSSMAYCYPNFVKSIIKDNGNKTYTVSMFDPEGKPIKVSVNSKFLADKNGKTLGVIGKNGANWSSILEKAMMKYNHIYKISRNYDLGRIGTEHVLPLFTGNGDSFAFAQFVLKPEDLARVVRVCLKQGKFVLGSFNVNKMGVAGSTAITAHVYTFMYSPNKSALFLMRNPWGNNPKIGTRNEGVLHIPNDPVIPTTIDVRIVDPGIAAEYK